MKSLFLLIYLLLPASLGAATGVPFRVNFQGKLLDNSFVPRNGQVAMQFRLFDAPTGGNLLWGPENQTPTVNNGVFSVQLGTNTLLSPDLLLGGSAYLSVTVSPDVFPAGEMSPRQQLIASPYAITAAQLSQAGDVRINAGVSYATFTAAGNILIPYGIVASSASFSGGITASSGSFTATGPGNFSIRTSSGINVTAGTLNVAEAVVAIRCAIETRRVPRHLSVLDEAPANTGTASETGCRT